MHGQLAIADLVNSGRPLPTAIFCHTDDLAFGVMATMRRVGLRCPQDLSVIAFDDHPMSQYWGLTTVSQHAHQQGVLAAVALLDAMNMPCPNPAAAALEGLQVELMVRETTAEPPK